MNGLELSKEYFNQYGKSILEDYPECKDLLCFGLTGSGSECYGYDDDISTDHDFEPGFCIFIPSEEKLDRKTAFSLERAYAKLPKEFMGYNRQKMSPVGGNRHGVIRIDEYFEKAIGSKTGELDLEAWLSIPSYALAEAINGEIFVDNFGEVSKIRENLKNMPEDIRKKRIAGNLLLMAQAGQYNYQRCLKHNEEAAAQLAVVEFVKSTMEVIFLLNKEYMPYYKWSFRAMRKLPKLSIIAETCEHLITTGNGEDMAEDKYFLIEDIASTVIDELISQGITEANCGDLEKHAYSVNDQIENSEIRNLNIFAGV